MLEQQQADHAQAGDGQAAQQQPVKCGADILQRQAELHAAHLAAVVVDVAVQRQHRPGLPQLVQGIRHRHRRQLRTAIVRSGMNENMAGGVAHNQEGDGPAFHPGFGKAINAEVIAFRQQGGKPAVQQAADCIAARVQVLLQQGLPGQQRHGGQHTGQCQVDHQTEYDQACAQRGPKPGNTHRILRRLV